MILAEKLSKSYGRINAVSEISFEIGKGEIIGFLGPNGAGKSTAMNLITGYLAPSSGRILIDETDILEYPLEVRRKIGYLPEIPPLYGDLTVIEYLQFVTELKKIARSERQNNINNVVDAVKIGDYRNRLIRNLSKGYRQRTGLAQALIGNPPILILDEPSVGLDPKQIIEIRQLIQNLGKDHTIVLSSHILSEVSATCKRILIISRGKIVASDTTDKLANRITGVSGASKLKLLVKGDGENVRQILEKLPSLESLNIEAGSGEGFTEVLLEALAEAESDIREDAFFALAEAKMPILSMSPQDLSLEEIFLNLTKDEE